MTIVMQFEVLNLSKLDSVKAGVLVSQVSPISSSISFCLSPLKIPIARCILFHLHLPSSYLSFPQL